MDQRPYVVLKALFEKLDKACKEGDKVAAHIKTCAVLELCLQLLLAPCTRLQS